MLVRLVIVLLATFGPTAPSTAAGDARYLNARFGYAVAIPAGFICGPEPDNGDGRPCRSKDGTARLTVWGGYADPAGGMGFGGEVAADIGFDRTDGLAITYQTTTPKWAVWSGTRHGLIVYERMIAGCGGDQYAAFKLEYPPVKIAAMKPVIDGLTTSLRLEKCNLE